VEDFFPKTTFVKETIMKKLKLVCFIGIAALFALAMVSCDDFTPPETVTPDEWDLGNEPPLKPGEFFVGLGGSGGRALTTALAAAGSDYFEVVLVDESGTPTVVHRTTFREGRYGRMEAPGFGDYDNTGDYHAYIFAGRYDDKTLLGIGVLTSVDIGDGNGLVAGTNIIAATRRVQFTVQALTTDINTEKDNSSTFKPWPGAGIESDISARIMIDNTPAPIFLLPPSGPLPATYDINTTHGVAVVVASTAAPPVTPTPPAPSITSRGYIWADGDYAPIVVPATVGAMTTSAALIRFALTINTQSAGATSGLGRLSLNVPVFNYSSRDSDNQDIPDLKPPVLWYIRGGINNSLIDQGPSFNNNRGSMGGAILIGVGNVLSGAGGFIVESTY
jgi:hypothetical protein